MPEDLTHLDTINTEEETDEADNLPDVGEPQLDGIFEEFDTYVRMAARGEQTGVIIVSRPGIGKSHRIDEVLQEEEENDDSIAHDHSFVSGYSSPLALYETLYANQMEGNVLVLDDVEGITQDDRSASLLKAALEGEGSGDERVVDWNSASNRLAKKDLPESFEFSGTIVFLFNEIPSGSVHWEAVISRCLLREFGVTFSDRMRMIREVAKADHGYGLDYSDRIDTANWLIERTTPDMDAVDLRTLIQAFELRTSSVVDGGEWKRMILDQLGYGRRKRAAQEAIAETPNLFEAQIVYRNTIEKMPAVDEEDPENWFLEQFDKETKVRYVKSLRTEVLDNEVDEEEMFIDRSWYDEIDSVGATVDHFREYTDYCRKTYFNWKNADLDEMFTDDE